MIDGIQTAESLPENSIPRDGHQRSVVASMMQEDAAVLQTHADIVTSAPNADSMGTTKIVALSRSDVAYGTRPKYLRYNVWDHEQPKVDNTIHSPYCLADWTEQAKPLLSVPTHELLNIEKKDHKK